MPLIYLEPISQFVVPSKHVIHAEIDAVRPEPAVPGHLKTVIDR